MAFLHLTFFVMCGILAATFAHSGEILNRFANLRGQKEESNVRMETLHKQSGISIHPMLTSKRNDPIKFSASHAKAAHEAIVKGEHSFSVSESSKLPADREIKSFKDVTSHVKFDAVSQYSFKKDMHVVSLDDARAAKHVVDISSTDLLYCGKADINTVFVSTHSAGSESNKRLSDFLAHDERASKSSGFAQVRQVVSKKSATKHDISSLLQGRDASSCHRLETENLHHLELFESFKVESAIEHPFRHKASQAVARKARAIEKDLQGEYPIHPDGSDPGVILCTNPWWKDDEMGSNDQNNDDGFQDYLNWSGDACVQYIKAIPGSFDFNYDSETNHADAPLDIATGITCANCFAFLGAGYLLIAEYSWTYGFQFEVKVAGGAGFNIDLEVSNPTISGSKTIELMGTGSWGYLDIGDTGLALGFQMGGLTATLSGSASATGSITFTAGAGLSASMGMMYTHNNGLQFPSTFNEFYNPPTLTNNGFEITSATVSLALAGTENMQLNYGDGTVTANFAATIAPTATLEWGSAISSAPLSVSHKLHQKSSAHNTAPTTDASAGYAPGDTISIDFNYADLPVVDEEIVLFYSLTDGIQKFSIMHRTFTLSSTGKGTFSAKWSLPWCQKFKTSKTWRIIVHTSLHMAHPIYDSEKFQVQMFTDTDSIFSNKMPATVQLKPNGYSFHAKWQQDLLSYFKVKPGTGGHGAHLVCKHVTIFLRGVSKASSDPAIQLALTDIIPNNGQAQVVIPRNISVGTASDFYLTVQCADDLDTMGWSQGFFQIEGISASATKATDRMVSKAMAPPAIVTAAVEKTELIAPARGLSSCAASLTYSLPGNAGLQSAKILSFTLAGNDFADFTLMSPYTNCFATIPAGAPSTPVSSPVSHPVANPTAKPVAPTTNDDNSYY